MDQFNLKVFEADHAAEKEVRENQPVYLTRNGRGVYAIAFSLAILAAWGCTVKPDFLQ